MRLSLSAIGIQTPIGAAYTMMLGAGLPLFIAMSASVHAADSLSIAITAAGWLCGVVACAWMGTLFRRFSAAPTSMSPDLVRSIRTFARRCGAGPVAVLVVKDNDAPFAVVMPNGLGPHTLAIGESLLTILSPTEMEAYCASMLLVGTRWRLALATAGWAVATAMVCGIVVATYPFGHPLFRLFALLLVGTIVQLVICWCRRQIRHRDDARVVALGIQPLDLVQAFGAVERATPRPRSSLRAVNRMTDGVIRALSSEPLAETRARALLNRSDRGEPAR